MLKSLELFGFKTFADRTRFDFPGGITCIVGPNGSGKSNVVDAIKWILGDQSPKSLRGKEMADVIFNGSASRKPSSFAEATMTLDNTSGWLSVEATEIQIGRRLWRTGESEYLINGQPARLRDIRDLLLGTGAAASAYNIIEQGRVDQILQASPAARRMVFEEAAGISRYKARKTEALRKLDRVAHNVERLTDIVDEVEAQLNATRSQAAKAAKYRELSEQVRRLWFGLAADEYRYLSAQLEEVERTVRQQKEQVDELSRQQEELEEELGGIEAEMAAQDESLRQVERQSSQCREKIASHRSTIRNQLLRRQELVGELDRLRRQRLAMAIRARRAAEQAEQARQQLADAEAEYESQRSHLESREDQLAKLRAKIQQQRDDLQEARQSEPELIQRIAECRNQLERLDEQLRLVREALGESDKRRADVEQKIRHAEQALAKQRSLVDASRDRLQEAENRLREQRRQYEESLAAQDQSQHKLADLRERRSATAARRSVLEDLEERQQGLGLGVKDILARAASSDHPPWCHILGSVADLVEVDLEEAAFVDVALGPRAQLLVMDDLAPLIRYLNENPATFAGRVGFIAVPDGAIESVGPVYPSQSSQGLAPPKPQLHGTLGRLPDLSELPGVIKRADEMVEPTGVGGKLAEYLLADTWVVDTLETAIELSQGRGRGCRFVTLQGEVLEPDGTLYAGTERVEDAVVSRKTELRRLKRDLEQLDRAIQQEEDRLAALDDSLRQFKQSLEEAESHKSRCQDEYDRLRRDMERAQEEQQQLQTEQETIESRLAELNQQETHLLAQQEQKQMELATAEEDERRLQERIAEQQRELAKLEHREQAWQNACAEEKLKLAKEEERLAGLRESFRRHQSDSNDWHEQSEEAARRWRAGCDKIRKIDLHVLNTAAAMAELYLEKERLSEQVQRFAGQKAALRQRRSQLLAVENQLREQRRQFGEELHAAEIQARDLRHQIQSTRSRIEEEYQIAFEEVLESGASALEDYLAERRNRKSGAGSKSTQASPQQSGGPNSESEFPPPAEDHDGRTGNATEETGFFAPPDSVAHGTDSHDGDAAPAADGTPPEAEQDPGRQNTEQAATDTTDSQPPISEAPVPQVTFEDVREELERRLARLRRKLKMMGSVNTESLHELEELEERYQRLNQQLEDLVEAKATLEEIVRRINAESRKMFLETFESIRKHFQELYRKLFAGGEGDIILEDPNDVLECGIDIVARPPGKELRSISLLSGGEKTLTAIALLLAIFKSRPSPFCVLDEVDAALDESNVDRYAAILKEFKHKTQFLIVTHNKRTMVVADTMYGITMQQSGVSKKMSVRFEDVGEDGEILVNSNSTAGTGSGPDSTAA